MFRYLSDDQIQVSIRPPLIYLDHCAIRGISSDPANSARLKKIFEARGTLMFSVINMIEMAANSGRSYDQIRTMLDALGPYWVPSDVDPGRVDYNEKRGAVMPKSFFPPLTIFAWGRLSTSSTTKTFGFAYHKSSTEQNSSSFSATRELTTWPVEHFSQLARPSIRCSGSKRA